ncbi:hypothetical protein [Actinocorallia libanotica]|uniref:Uncharacterized protein n=1 Tax=Actinocorallia libanotica TaxID=46162 RepID=A0ABN1Q165_9ACTN
MKLLGRVAAMKYRTCRCCNPRSAARYVKRSAKRKEARAWRREP